MRSRWIVMALVAGVVLWGLWRLAIDPSSGGTAEGPAQSGAEIDRTRGEPRGTTRASTSAGGEAERGDTPAGARPSSATVVNGGGDSTDEPTGTSPKLML